MLAESQRQLGGRVFLEPALPGLSEWARVRDYRVAQIQTMENVKVFLESTMIVEVILATEADHVVIATGATWCADGVGFQAERAI
jgi:dimethylamine/trimethylamine dehydrogenase